MGGGQGGRQEASSSAHGDGMDEGANPGNDEGQLDAQGHEAAAAAVSLCCVQMGWLLKVIMCVYVCVCVCVCVLDRLLLLV